MSLALYKRCMSYCLKITLVVVVMIGLIVSIDSQWQKQRPSARTFSLAQNDLSPCAFLECSHASSCTTRNKTCCIYVLKRSLVFLASFFHQHKIPYVIIYGTLLGAVRNKTIIPWTRDLDIGFFNWTYLRSEKIRNELYQHGFYLFDTLNLTRLCVHKNTSDTTLLTTYNVEHKPPASIFDLHAYVDLYHASINDAASRTSNRSMFSIEFSKSFLSPISFTKNATIDDVAYPTVDNVEQHLVHFYTKDYMRDIRPRIP